MHAYKASIFSEFVASPPPVGDYVLSFILLSYYSPSLSTVLSYSKILDSGLPAPQCWSGIWIWWITIFSFTVIFLLHISLILSFVYWIATGNESGSPSGVLGDPLALCGTIISSLNWSPMIPQTKSLLSVIIEDLIVCRNVHGKMMLHATPSPRARETITSFPFTAKRFSGNYCSNVYTFFYLFTLFTSIYSTYIECIHDVQILQILKFQHQVRMALYDWLVIPKPKLAPVSAKPDT